MFKDALKFLLSSKTMVLQIVVIFAILLLGFVSLAVLIIFNVENPYFNNILNIIGIGDAAGTTRNVISDGIMPRIPQAIGAAKDPSVSVQSPQSMTLANPPVKGDDSLTITAVSNH